MTKMLHKYIKTPTTELLSKITYTKNIKNYIIRNKENFELPTLTEHLKELCDNKEIKPKEVITNADMDRIYGAEIFSGKRQNPSRDYIIRLAFGFGLDYNECQRLLVIAGKSQLYPRVPRDAVIINCLHNSLNFKDTENALYDAELSSLRGKEK